MTNEPFHVERLAPRHASIAPRLRRSDIEELHKISDVSPEFGVAWSIANSEQGLAGVAGDRVVAIGGVSAVPGARRVGSVWMLATDEIHDHRVAFLRASSAFVAKLKREYDRLENTMDGANEISARWLESLGFKLDSPDELGLRYFAWDREDDARCVR